MSNARDTDRTEEMRANFVAAMVTELGVSEAIAVPFADAVVVFLQREHAGDRLYVPQPVRRYDMPQMATQLRGGNSARMVARQHRITLRKLHQLFPGGLPKCDTGENA